MKCRIFFFGLALMLPIMVLAQEQDESVNFDAYVAQLNAKCPIVYGDGWAINSFTTSGDSAIVEITVPAVLEAYMPLLSGDSAGVKKIWINQMDQYGEQWKRFVEMMVSVDRSLVLRMIPEDSETSATIVFDPSDFAK